MAVKSIVLLVYNILIGQMVLSSDLRIFDGISEDIRQFPYFGYIVSGVVYPNTEYIDPTPLCGAVLIADSYILTHASCVEDYQQKKLFVVFGMTSWCPPISFVEELHHYADLSFVNFQNVSNGLAVAGLNRPIPITSINAPLSAQPFRNAIFALPGLGRIGPDSLPSCQPLIAQLVPVDPTTSRCPLDPGALCFQPFREGLHGSMCIGDIGGPVIERIEGKDYLRGIAWGTAYPDCRGMNLARDVWAALPWIRSIVQDFK